MTKEEMPARVRTELNVAWIQYNQRTHHILDSFDPDVVAMIRTAFEAGYAFGAANQANLEIMQANNNSENIH
jgi:hypothetical protein